MHVLRADAHSAVAEELSVCTAAPLSGRDMQQHDVRRSERPRVAETAEALPERVPLQAEDTSEASRRLVISLAIAVRKINVFLVRGLTVLLHLLVTVHVVYLIIRHSLAFFVIFTNKLLTVVIDHTAVSGLFITS